MPDIDYALVWEHAYDVWEATGADEAATAVIREAVEAAYGRPAPDPDLVTWTPEDGPLTDALAGLPARHPVTIRGDWGVLHGLPTGSPALPVAVRTGPRRTEAALRLTHGEEYV